MAAPVGGSYAVIITTNGLKLPIVNQNYPIPAGSIRTIVIVDDQGGGAISTLPLVLNDLN